ncbi:FAD-binding domain-containing protein [Daldinia caldariorum]|uniref:FAD-binding domain-containing protein n=1 Tax=Daldinia caldariorum TaxID=326644 RepID=UPI00200853C5|nr:FAD-binding domain-containing protein [Daldinia caldariorum]KAI1472378.1 FAD-binding domain-containing protein [Daldinia caldariorum]
MTVSLRLLALASAFAYSDAFPGNSKTTGRHDPVAAACKAAPGSPDWPSADTWAQFNQSTGGKLLRAAPPGAICHPKEPTYNAAQCATISQEWLTYDFAQDDPVSNMWNQYNNDTCLPDPNAPCSPDGYPAYVVNATTARDIKLSVDFARTHNVRIIVKSTGHDYQGRSQAPGALSIWTHHMQDLETHALFQPRGCDFTINHTAATVGPGSQLGSLYEELGKIGQIIVGGDARSVSVGGYLTGGGHSILAPKYGLAADQILEMEVVTPAGDIVVANECRNQDLFWAMRGGGGSTFGVMSSVTLMTYPSPKVVSATVMIMSPKVNAPYYADLAGYLLSQFPYLDSKGVSGYSVVSGNFSYPGVSIGGTGMGGFFLLTDTQDENDMVNIWAPIIEHVNKTWPEVTPTIATQTYTRLQDWFETHYDSGSAGTDMWLGSHLLDAETLAKKAIAVGEAFKDFQAEVFLVAGQGVKNAKPRGGSDSVNPSWRKAIAHALTSVQFQPLNQTAKVEALAKVNAKIEPLRRLAPEMGSYLNENNPGVPNWQRSFWGDNYDRLLRIKRAVDPNDVFWCHPCVGNDRWEEVGYQLCRVD